MELEMLDISDLTISTEMLPTMGLVTDEINMLTIVTMKDGIKYIHTTGKGSKNKGNFYPISK